MSLDVGQVGLVAAQLMEALAEDYADEPSARVGAVAVVVELETETESHITFKCSDLRPWIQIGLLSAATRTALSSSEGED